MPKTAVIKTEKQEIPAVLLEPVPFPNIKPPAQMTKLDLAILAIEDEKAIETCNDQIADIKKIVKSNK